MLILLGDVLNDLCPILFYEFLSINTFAFRVLLHPWVFVCSGLYVVEATHKVNFACY